MDIEDIEEIKTFIDARRKKMSWYNRLAMDIKINYLHYKYRLEDWIKEKYKG